MDSNKRKKRGRLLPRLGLWLLILLVVAFVAFHLLWMFLSSLKPATELFKMPPTFLPKQPTAQWYMEAFGNSLVVRYFFNSLIVAVATMLVNMVIGTTGAYSLARFRYRGRRLILVGVLSSYCVPAIMLLIPLYRIIAGLGLSYSYIGVIIGHVTVTLPFCIWQLIPFFQNIPREIEEAALVDGASGLTTFCRIVLPLCTPGILSTGIMSFILSWNEYLLSSVLVSSDTMKTLTVGLANFISSTEINWGVIMALGTATTIPIVLLFTAIQKYFVEGLTSGAVKG